MTEEQAYILIHRHLAGEASPAERRQLEIWLNTSAENRTIFDEAEKIWHKLNAPQPENVPSFDEFWQKLEGRLAAETKPATATIVSLEKAQQRKFLRSAGSTRWLAAAAVLIILVGAAIMYQRIFKTTGRRVYATRNAERLPVILPDGSRIELNAASELRFRDSTFDTLRLVELIGQAFFEVTPSAAGLPFALRTGNAEIRVLGTSFDVRARNQKTQVMVQTGKVALQALSAPAQSAVVLTAGQMSLVEQSALPTAPISVDATLIAAWRKQKLVFDSTPLAEIAAELQRVYDIEITIADRELESLAITGTFEQQPVTDILASLCLALHLKYSGSDGKYVISR
jgi:ferric-dicitrate binding protein FerR (iron transport regulator)